MNGNTNNNPFSSYHNNKHTTVTNNNNKNNTYNHNDIDNSTYNENNDININNSNQLHQRSNTSATVSGSFEHKRTQLFGPGFGLPNFPAKTVSNNEDHDTKKIYHNENNSGSDVPLNYSNTILAQLESQSEKHMNVMGTKIKALKELSVKMGDEIRSSNQTIDQLGNTFENTSAKIKKNFRNMMDMAKNSRVSLRTWLIIFIVIIFFFLRVWTR
ncbi:Bet1p SCDLUD_005153 [Saccharomycodes ludwigii]|uniref:Bet1p n=1 Tax=Saccharomycodes ludwigii TaxID=36035 RepID=UPI001E89002D|nr:hypothetical protein SCDLUD_005153 [Saccharomycodes ludwigii]KAH3898815.1 hypothetical protein SCDLUD_005153 [Saccharomycodes ludwigii]